ncbi:MULTISPECIES: glutamate synthase large subunit [unclassified Brevibacterium]|uniref:glutamate synthase large subunit n=1 Tax=unclassified Brevibacterium TaxID=2614124 RepID=UPI0010F6ED69|nr:MULTISPECIES: glutamate synthase large subunit [unclassified Brevibacterium]MCM1012510.1 glutamate synthase large subunit [Brevibacterium sp. XM4083]
MSRETSSTPQLPPQRTGLYDPALEHDACGLALIVRYRGTADHEVVEQALRALRKLEHRGGIGSDEGTGDGAGLTLQIPHDYFAEVLRAEQDIDLPAPGEYAVGIGFFSQDYRTDLTGLTSTESPIPAGEFPTAGEEPLADEEALVRRIAAEEGLSVLAIRDVPRDESVLGEIAASTQPHMRHVFFGFDARYPARDADDLRRRSYIVRKRLDREGIYFPSLSPATITYKGMLATGQLAPYYTELNDARVTSRIALVHSRFSTNTFPSWQLAQPFGTIAHNGEINTVRGNRNWMRAREAHLASDLLASPVPETDSSLERLFPIVPPGASDSASFNAVLELMVASGRSLPQAMLMMIPEAWENNPGMGESRKAFYEYHSLLMEPWDGPACVGFTDGKLAGAVLDRNGLRPARYVMTSDTVVLASEIGVVDLPEADIVGRGRLTPGRMFLVDTESERIISDTEIKNQLATQHPYAEWVADSSKRLEDLPTRVHVLHPQASVRRRQRTFGYTEEELRLLITPMAETGAEPLGAMGTDTAIAGLSTRPRLLFDYFHQNFAQVTNPPLDSIREHIVTSMAAGLGREGNLLEHSRPDSAHIMISRPVIDNDELAAIGHVKGHHLGVDTPRPTVTLSGLYSVNAGPDAMEARIEALCAEASAAVDAGAVFIILSDRDSTADLAPIPSLLLTSALHHHLVRERSRTRVSIVVEAGDVREVHHAATLVSFGASAVNPYLLMETAEALVRSDRVTGVSESAAVANVLGALNKGLLKIMSKMGISTVQSYHGAQTFEAVGLSDDLIDRHFTSTPHQLGGKGMREIAAENTARHADAHRDDHPRPSHRPLGVGGEYQWRREGPGHLFNPETIFKLQHATASKRYDIFEEYTRAVDDQSRELMTLRGLLDLVPGAEGPIDISEVEPAEAIMKRFSTGAMSYGSISKEAHETLAIAMNRIGGKSNTGEGGEDVDRLLDPERRSAIKQIASGRFGVTSHYLTEADDLQIKMAQGAKPGEGGQLPGEKVYPWIAKTRHATPGVGLISPPPHHDIYSIEDLAQLIYDLGRANARARVHVKLVSAVGVGTVAAGVAKAGADVVLISGHDGGTGASPLNSLKHAGTPWELGLAEAQQTLILNGLREKVSVQVDGQLKTGRDVIIAALLGAEEFGFATTALVVSGCIMMRVCHKDTCPVGVATQNPLLRSRYTGQADHVVNFFTFIAEEVRGYLAQLGFRTLDEAIGAVERLRVDEDRARESGLDLDLSTILTVPGNLSGDTSVARKCAGQVFRDFHGELDPQLLEQAREAIETKSPVTISSTVVNTDRSVGTLLGHHVTRAHADRGLPEDTIRLELHGTAGQSLGAYLPIGVSIDLTGDANDYVGKGLSGGTVAVHPAPENPTRPEHNVIAGNVIGYGATSGKLFISGQVGERFMVRNSGAEAVVEGIGDHGLEYMTGGVAVILGGTGRNFAAGMSGGTAYVLDFNPARLNPDERAAGVFRFTGVGVDDMEVLERLLGEHVEWTDSPLAAQLLDGLRRGEDVLSRFTKIIPVAYQAVRDIQSEMAAEGTPADSDAAWRKILEVTHG